MIRIEHDAATGEIQEIELTDKEIKDLAKAAENVEALVAKEKAEYEAKRAAHVAEKAALLTQLGITEEQAKLLLS